MDDAQPGATVALKDLLQPFQSAQGRQLTAVLGKDTGEGEEIVLALGSMALVFRCHEDSDTIAISFRACDEVSDFDDLTADPAWSRFIGKEFFWGWLTVNQQGCCDGVLLSFDGVVPEVGLNVIASGFEVLEIRQRA